MQDTKRKFDISDGTEERIAAVSLKASIYCAGADARRYENVISTSWRL